MKLRKFLCILAVTTILSGTFVGCSSSDKAAVSTDKTQTEQTKQAEPTEVKQEGSATGLASEKPLTMTVHMGTNDTGVFLDSWTIFQEAAKMTNVTLKGTLPDTIKTYNETFNLVLASGDLPDIMQGNQIDFIQYGPEGAFLPLNELIDEHAPDLKKFLDENPHVKSMASDMDGNIWFIPYVPDGRTERGWFIRKDWLEKLGLEEPKTVEELHTVLTAFANEDPNGNNKKDEVPFMSRSKMVGLYGLMSLWGAVPDFYAIDGKVIFGPCEEEYGVALTNIAQWYKEGLIDKEYFTRDSKARDILLGDNVGGMTHDFFASTGSYNEIFEGKIEGFRFEPIAPPADIDGVIKEYTSREKVKSYGWGISHSNPDPIAAIKYFNFWFTEEGARLANFGIEGDTYTMVDGKPIFTDKVLKDPEKTAIQVLYGMGGQSGFGFPQDFAYEEQWTNPIALEGVQLYEDNDWFMEKYPALKFTNEEQKEIQKFKPKADTYLGENVQQWILGSKEVNHEEFVAEFKKMGIDKIIEIHQAAYDRYVAEMGK